MPPTPTEIVESEIRPFAKDWEDPKPGEEHYSTNQLIAAYEAGYAKGLGVQALVKEKFERNIGRSGSDTKKLISKLQEYGFTPAAARLKVVSWEQFEVLVTLSEVEYLDEKFESIYEFVGELENSSREENYSINFRFCPELDGFDEQKVKSDGFTLHHRSLAQ